jgi:hypothetical protein
VIFSWLGFLVNIAVAGGFVLVCALRAKRIGGIGPWLVASIGVIDALLLLVFRVHALMGRDPTASFADIERNMLVLEGFDMLFTMLSAVLALVGFALMMPKTIRRG